MENNNLKKTTPNIVTFRLDSDTRQALITASTSANQSPHEYAKQTLINNLQSQNQLDNIELKLETLEQNLEKLIKTVGVNLAFFAYEWMQEKTNSVEESREWLERFITCIHWNEPK